MPLCQSSHMMPLQWPFSAETQNPSEPLENTSGCWKFTHGCWVVLPWPIPTSAFRLPLVFLCSYGSLWRSPVFLQSKPLPLAQIFTGTFGGVRCNWIFGIKAGALCICLSPSCEVIKFPNRNIYSTLQSRNPLDCIMNVLPCAQQLSTNQSW